MRKAVLMTAEQAKSLYEQNNSFRETLLSEFTDEELGIKKKLKSWEELKNLIEGWWVFCDSSLRYDKNIATEPKNKNVFATQKQAQSALAMAQLSQLMADLGDECDVDWNHTFNYNKHIIYRSKNILAKNFVHSTYSFLAFKTESVRDAFLEKHKELIKQYFMI